MCSDAHDHEITLLQVFFSTVFDFADCIAFGVYREHRMAHEIHHAIVARSDDLSVFDDNASVAMVHHAFLGFIDRLVKNIDLLGDLLWHGGFHERMGCCLDDVCIPVTMNSVKSL